MVDRISETIRQLFPDDFDELKPVKRPWWERIDYEKLLKGWRVWVIAAVLVVIAWGGVYYYNQFLNMELAVIAAAHQVEVTYQRRKDVLNNLQKTVLDYQDHERMMFRYVTDKRVGVKSPAKDAAGEIATENQTSGLTSAAGGANLGDLFGNFFAVAESYPDLKLNENFALLMKGLLAVEKELVIREMIYNEEISLYGTYIVEVPQMFYNWIFRFRQYDYIQVDKDAHMLVPLDTGIDQAKA